MRGIELIAVAEALSRGPLADVGMSPFAIPQAKSVGARVVVVPCQPGVTGGHLATGHQIGPEVQAGAAEGAPFFQEGHSR